MGDPSEFLLGVIIFLAIGCFCGFVMGEKLESANTKNMGQMVCEDNGHGDFIKFDSYNKIIECEPKPNYQKYDGGYIKVVDNAR